jgi:hypothetical protein
VREPLPSAALGRADEAVVVALAAFGDDAAFSLGTVKSHIKRGGEKLRASLQAYKPIEADRHVR